MRKIVLINPPQVFSDTMTAAGVVPPLGLMYIAAVLKKEGYEVKLIDCVAEAAETVTPFSGKVCTRGINIQKTVDRVHQWQPDLIGISNLFSFAWPVVQELVKRIKAKSPHIPLTLGGAHPSALPERVLETSEADFVVISEGEQTVLDLVSAISNNRDFQGIDGLAYREKDHIHINPKLHFIEDIDKIPFPARELIPLEKYIQAKESHGLSRKIWTPLISSRGCPYECSFCTPHLWGKRYRVRSSKNVLDEIEECFSLYGIEEFHFEDENLTIDRERIFRICEGIQKIDSGLKWQAPNGIRANLTNKDMLMAMKNSGCEHITIAPESGSERVLEHIIHKRQKLSDIVQVVNTARRMKIRTLAYFMMGIPGETKNDIRLTLNFIKQLAKSGLDEVGISNYIPLPGSELYKKCVDEGKLNINNWFDLLSIADLTRSVSWSDGITDKELKVFRRRGYLVFHFTKIIHRPVAAIISMFNMLTGRQRLKTERVVHTILRRKYRRWAKFFHRSGRNTCLI